MSVSLPLCQVHLDFHTSEQLADVGSDFDPREFAETLSRAGVRSVNVFAKCHHGWLYYDTALPWRHPGLRRNLLMEQVRALHAVGIRCPVYVSVGWDELQARLHPEWLEVHDDGRRDGPPPLQPGWHKLDFASPYIGVVEEQVRDLLATLGAECDGLWFDILYVGGVHGPWSLARFDDLGWDPADPHRQAAFRSLLLDECCHRLTSCVRELAPDVPVFHNSGHIGPSVRSRLEAMTHLELESLPTGGWGYDHFPIVARYARTLGKPFLGMTGKFLEMWGHFQSYKPVAALEFECLQSLALGGACCIGDQLHPRGRLDEETYRRIGAAFRTVERYEPFIEGSERVVEAAVLHPELWDRASRLPDAAVGAVRMLGEGSVQFDFIDEQADLSGYRVVVLPEGSVLSGPFAERLAGFLRSGGALLTMGAMPGCLGQWPEAPCDVVGSSSYSPDYLEFGEDLGGPRTVVAYDPGVELRPREGADPLAWTVRPYFNRTWRSFCSHAHTPPEGSRLGPAVVRRGAWIHFSHPLLGLYARHPMVEYRELLLRSLDLVAPGRAVRHEGPRSIRAHLRRQGERWLLHVLHYLPEKRGATLEVVEDPLPIHRVRFTARVPARRVEWVGPGSVCAQEMGEGWVRFEVADGLGHGLAVLS
ncbi:MAG: beta-galactosidase trimerization domain-containing protein [Fimbriimonadales bacterium]|nr:beta-galactosidase trimerization domain-containing protein [Fimbriimonadales bacterium]